MTLPITALASGFPFCRAFPFWITCFFCSRKRRFPNPTLDVTEAAGSPAALRAALRDNGLPLTSLKSSRTVT